MPQEFTVIAVTALLAGLLLIGIMLAGRRATGDSMGAGDERSLAPRRSSHPDRGREPNPRGAQATLRVVWWLTITIVLLGVGISGSFAADQAPIFLLGAGAVTAVVLFHELSSAGVRPRGMRLLELLVATALISALLVLTGFASSPFAMLFALVAVAAALAYGPAPGFAAAGLATLAFGAVLFTDPNLAAYGAEDALRLSVGLVATWLLAFVAIAYAGHQRRAVAHVLALSRTDPLTGLFNRSQLFVTLEQEVSRTRRSDRGFCVLMIDVDGLKAINDNSGHLRGDEILRALGSVIQASIRNVDSAYRFGGDEFVVLLPETDIVGAFVVAEKIRSGAEEVGMSMAGTESMTSVSIGLVSHPEDGLSAEELMTAADRAMYQAKKLGKNQISGNPRPRAALLARRSVGAEAPPVPDARQDAAVTAPPEDRAVAVELGSVETTSPAEHAALRPETDESEADPQEVRRRIAVANRSFDPDHQIRRAMDAFFSPTPNDVERPSPDH